MYLLMRCNQKLKLPALPLQRDKVSAR